MRAGLEQAGIETVWANDIEPAKRELYVANFGSREFVLADVRDVRGRDVPDIELATASFPCTDLSLAGNRRGLGDAAAPPGVDGGSSMFWEFARILDEMGGRRPDVVLLENVLGFGSSNDGRDLQSAVLELNRLGYSCDVRAIDARHFVPQSRPRMFVVGITDPPPHEASLDTPDSPRWLSRLLETTPGARLHQRHLPELPRGPQDLRGVIDTLAPDAPDWWSADRVARFVESLSPINHERLSSLRSRNDVVWRTAYRRTRAGRAVWEIRADGIAGCLRTARGGSSKQALVECAHGKLRIRWMTPREYARLMGAPAFILPQRRSQALFGLGDAVCVPVVRWLCENYVISEVRSRRRQELASVA
jgi:DNA (cytosine-5)-methyltransferase 1